jgi:hypothetical protein
VYKGFNYNEPPSYPRPPTPSLTTYQRPQSKAVVDISATRHKVTIVGYNHDKQNRLAYHLWHAARDADWRLEDLVTLGRQDLDMNKKEAQFKELLACDADLDHTIIINLYDRRPGYEWVQESVFSTIWSMYKDHPNVQVAVIGSLAHHYPNLKGVSERYLHAKRHLSALMTKTYEDALRSKARLLYIELGVLESMLEQSPPWPARYLTNKEAAESIIALARVNNKILFSSLTGNHVWTPPSLSVSIQG